MDLQNINISKNKYNLINEILFREESNLDLLISGMIGFTDSEHLNDFIHWINTINEKINFAVSEIPLYDLKNWFFNDRKDLVHESGKFFKILGVRIKTNTGPVTQWDQPIIYQPEIGILGILSQKRDGILYFLMQLKIEPGNINKIQLSPTVQATKSNYTQVHGGTLPLYLDYFIQLNGKRIIVDQLQSEQGARFLKKRNRNMIIVIGENEKVDVVENFCWLTLGQIKQLLQHNSIIHMDTRSVLSCTQFKLGLDFSENALLSNYCFSDFQKEIMKSILNHKNFVASNEEILSWFTKLKCETEFELQECHIDELLDWEIGDYSIRHKSDKYFQVVAIRTIISSREVNTWDQPMIKQRETGLIGFIVKKINGIMHILIQAKLEVGNFDVLELAPTVQCITGSYTQPEYKVHYLDYFLKKRGIVHYDTLQSEEGGRFYHEQNRYMVIEVSSDFSTDIYKNFIWMTFNQSKEFIKYNNYFNIEARSLLSSIIPI